MLTVIDREDNDGHCLQVLLTGRVVVGAAIGIASAVVPVYISEVPISKAIKRSLEMGKSQNTKLSPRKFHISLQITPSISK